MMAQLSFESERRYERPLYHEPTDDTSLDDVDDVCDDEDDDDDEEDDDDDDDDDDSTLR